MGNSFTVNCKTETKVVTNAVYIIAEIDDNDIICRVFLHNESNGYLYRIEGKAQMILGNPYLVYGDVIEDATGLFKFQTNVTVSTITSGSLLD